MVEPWCIVVRRAEQKGPPAPVRRRGSLGRSRRFNRVVAAIARRGQVHESDKTFTLASDVSKSGREFAGCSAARWRRGAGTA